MDQYDNAACTTDVAYAIRQLRVHGDVQRALDALDRVAARLGVVVVLDESDPDHRCPVCAVLPGFRHDQACLGQLAGHEHMG